MIDLYSRRVVGWSFDSHMSTELVGEALQMALVSKGHPRGVTVHSDRGSQYYSNAFRAQLERAGLIGSMSRKGCCHDNAVAESFFHSMKIEAIHGESFGTREQLQRRVFEYIELDYNRTRLHSTLGYLSPSEVRVGVLGSTRCPALLCKINQRGAGSQGLVPPEIHQGVDDGVLGVEMAAGRMRFKSAVACVVDEGSA